MSNPAVGIRRSSGRVRATRVQCGKEVRRPGAEQEASIFHQPVEAAGRGRVRCQVPAQIGVRSVKVPLTSGQDRHKFQQRLGDQGLVDGLIPSLP